MRRWHSAADQRVMKARKKFWHSTENDKWWYRRHLGSERSLGRFRDRHPLDCGGRCYLCHYEKLLYKGKRRQEKHAEIRFELETDM